MNELPDSNWSHTGIALCTEYVWAFPFLLTKLRLKVLRRLADMHNLSTGTREKTPMDVEDLTLIEETILTTSRVRYDHGRQRIQNILFLALMSLSGNRPEAILNLRYQDITVALLRDPDGGPHRRLLEFTPQFTKGFLGLKEG